jgi:hypothetical protein
MKVNGRLAIWKTLFLMLACVLVPGSARAADPDYDLPGQFALPWSCGDGHEVTWDAEGHWDHHKATGIAFDFSMEEGTPLFAPTNGRVYFLHDERPLETNFGHYVEIVSGDGNWMVRLAHLRDPQSGERQVKAGDLIGHSGSSGVPAEHLHMELLVRKGETWRCPDAEHLERFFGLPTRVFAEETIIRNRGCPAKVLVDGPVKADTNVSLGQMVPLLVPLRNDGLEQALLDDVHVLLTAPAGASLTAQAHGPWTLEGKSSLMVRVPFQPNVSGPWTVKELAYVVDGQPHTVEAKGEMTVEPSTLRLAKVSPPSRIGVGEDITLTTQIENTGEEDLAFEDLVLEGERPDGAHWTARAGQSGVLAGGEKRSFVLCSAVVPQDVGLWHGMRIGYSKEGKTFYFDETVCSFPVEGAELGAAEVRAYASSDVLRVFLKVSNVGTAAVEPDSIEIWGWKPHGERTFGARREAVAPLQPGGAALFQFDVPMDDVQGKWELAEAGYWTEGDYYPILLSREDMVLHEALASKGR